MGRKGIDVSYFIVNTLGYGAFADLLRGGVNFIRNVEFIDFLYNEFKEKLKYEIVSSKKTIPIIKTEEITLSEEDLHSQLIELIIEIGRMNNFLTEKEYIAENIRFDVIWRRIDKGSPTYVFEVQVGGNIYSALAKLKHAYDLWNSNIFFIISSNKDLSSAQTLLNGTFHEIKNKVKIISAYEIKKLFLRKKSWIDYEKKLKIL
ncbi:MAG: hypothetical protein NC827_04930 [Candidatus Omnitrophica bacterium]|nr:hypothetical protein [Candidatus Omnitrophota bacterium]MCM8802636.1 hypothetical protein [Candidatus Omnitrophota bacterium]